MSAADIEGLPSYPTEEGSGRGIALLASPMSCTLPFVAFPVCVSVVFTLSAEEAKRQKNVAKMQFRDAFLFHWCKAFISILYPVQLLVLWGSENNCLRATSSKLWMHTDAGRGTNTMADKDSL